MESREYLQVWLTAHSLTVRNRYCYIYITDNDGMYIGSLIMILGGECTFGPVENRSCLMMKSITEFNIISHRKENEKLNRIKYQFSIFHCNFLPMYSINNFEKIKLKVQSLQLLTFILQF